MNTTPPALPGKPRRKHSPGCMICLILLGIMVALLAWHVVWRIGNSRAVARLEKNARDRGEPMNFAEVAAFYAPVPDSSNGFVSLAAVWAVDEPDLWKIFISSGGKHVGTYHDEKLPEGLPKFDTTSSPSERLSPDSLKIIEEYLSPKRAQILALREAAKRPAFRAPTRFEDGYSALLPYLSRIKKDAKLFQLEAACAIEQGRGNDTLDWIEAIGRSGHCLNDDPFFIGQLVRIAIYTIAINTSERLLSQHRLDSNQLARLSKVITSLDGMPGLKHSLIGERGMTFGFLNDPERMMRLSAEANSDATDGGTDDGEKLAFGLRLLTLSGMMTAERRLVGETYERAIRCVENPKFATNTDLKLIENEMQAKATGFPPKKFTQMVMPSFQKNGDKFARLEARRRCAITAINVELYRIKNNGVAPERLSDFLGTILTDPFNGESLRYKQTDRGFVIYSVGPDRNDDDGDLEILLKGAPFPNEGDVGFEVERVGSR